MKISVVTVCFNAVQTIGYTIDSFLWQTHGQKELIVVDGGSTDGTLEIVRSYPEESVRLIAEPDRGMYDAANKGLKAYTGDVVGFLNADDRYHDAGVLSDIAAALKDADLVSGNLDYVRDHASREVVRRWRGTPFRKDGFRRGWMPAHPTVYARRHVVECVGPYDLAYRVASDYDWMLRAYELHDFRAAFIDRVLIDMMAGGMSTVSLRSHISHNLEALASRRRWLGSGAADYALFAKPLRKVRQFVVPSARSAAPAE